MDRLGTTPAASRGGRSSGTIRKIDADYTHGGAILQFKTAMLDAGITPPVLIIGDGQLHRFKIEGKLNGAYKLHLDGRPAGYFKDFKQDIEHTWKQAGAFMPLSAFQRQEFAKKKALDEAAHQAEEDAKHAGAAKKAVYIWNNAKPAPDNHPYLVTKRIGTHGARLGRDNTLIIPLYDHDGYLVNLQFISATGGKRFLAGGLKKGCFYGMGTDPNTVLIAEGFATGASLFEDSGYLTVVAFDAGNLTAVAKEIKSLYPDSGVIICGDNDESGVGQKAARAAALAVGGKYILPPTLGDFNDMLSGSAL